MIACLASFLGVSPFRETQDPMFDARFDLLYRDAMEKLDEVEDEACMKYVARKMLAWYAKYQPKNDGAAAAVEASAPPPQRTPNRPAAAADGPRPKRGMALSVDESEAAKSLLNKRALQAGLSRPGGGGGVLGT
jgi:hypothetical protein